MGSTELQKGSFWDSLRTSLRRALSRREAITSSSTALLPAQNGGTRSPDNLGTTNKYVATSDRVAGFLRERAISYLEKTGDVPSAVSLLERDSFLRSVDQRCVRQILTDHGDNVFALGTFEDLARAIGSPVRELSRAIEQDNQSRGGDSLTSAWPQKPNVDSARANSTAKGGAEKVLSEPVVPDQAISPRLGVWPVKTEVVWADTKERLGDWQRLLELIEGSRITNPERTLQTIKEMLATNRKELVSSKRFNQGRIKPEPNSPRAGQYEGMRQVHLGGKRRMIWNLETDKETGKEIFLVVVGDKDRLGFHKRHDKTRSL